MDKKEEKVKIIVTKPFLNRENRSERFSVGQELELDAERADNIVDKGLGIYKDDTEAVAEFTAEREVKAAEKATVDSLKEKLAEAQAALDNERELFKAGQEKAKAAIEKVEADLAAAITEREDLRTWLAEESKAKELEKRAKEDAEKALKKATAELEKLKAKEA
jgi:hypothetical protein